MFWESIKGYTGLGIYKRVHNGLGIYKRVHYGLGIYKCTIWFGNIKGTL